MYLEIGLTACKNESNSNAVNEMEGTVNVVLVMGKEYIPTKNGTLIYLNPGDDLQPALDRVEKNGGKVILHKIQISLEMGYYAFFIDSEANKLGLHSQK